MKYITRESDTQIAILIFVLGLFLLGSSHGICQDNDDSTLIDQNSWDYIQSFKDSLPIENPITLINIGYSDVYRGNNERGNAIMAYALTKIPNPDDQTFHKLSVQNTKNGNYQLAVGYLDKSVKLNPEGYGYYGWVMLYYYRDYDRALIYLEKFDSLTPGFSDFPMGESIHFLKGLAYMRKHKLNEAITAFDTYINEVTEKSGEEWVDVVTFYYKGLCYQLQNNYKKALSVYDKALKYDKSFTEVYYQKARCEMLLNEKEKAYSDFKRSKELIQQNLIKRDLYMEFFYPVYIQDIEKEILNCQN